VYCVASMILGRKIKGLKTGSQIWAIIFVAGLNLTPPELGRTRDMKGVEWVAGGFGANQVVDLLLGGVQAAHGRRDLGGQGVHLEVLSVPPGDIARGFGETRETKRY